MSEKDGNETKSETPGTPVAERIDELVRRVGDLELATATDSPTEREADLERALGMRNHENRALERELAAVRATRDSHGARIEELEFELGKLRKILDDANSRAERQGARIADLVAEVERLEAARSGPKFESESR